MHKEKLIFQFNSGITLGRSAPHQPESGRHSLIVRPLAKLISDVDGVTSCFIERYKAVVEYHPDIIDRMTLILAVTGLFRAELATNSLYFPATNDRDQIEITALDAWQEYPFTRVDITPSSRILAATRLHDTNRAITERWDEVQLSITSRDGVELLVAKPTRLTIFVNNAQNNPRVVANGVLSLLTGLSSLPQFFPLLGVGVSLTFDIRYDGLSSLPSIKDANQ